MRGVRSRVLARHVKAREVGRTVEIIARIVAAATTNVFVVGDASSRDGRWSVGGEVDWQGLRRRVGCKRAASSARLSVGLGRDQVDVFIFDRHCHRFLALLGFIRSQIINLEGTTIVPTYMYYANLVISFWITILLILRITWTDTILLLPPNYRRRRRPRHRRRPPPPLSPRPVPPPRPPTTPSSAP